MEIKQAEFVTSVVSMKNYQDTGYPEIAIVGKSNVGKSSFINSLTNNRKLARISAQPGKTRLINFFVINRSFCLVDLPGYGYARVSQQEKEKWGHMIEDYFAQSPSLSHMFHLVDIRHEPTMDDALMREWLHHYQIPYTIIATKSDKIARSKWKLNIDAIRKKLAIPSNIDIIPFSVPGKIGREEVLTTITRILETTQKA